MKKELIAAALVLSLSLSGCGSAGKGTSEAAVPGISFDEIDTAKNGDVIEFGTAEDGSSIRWNLVDKDEDNYLLVAESIVASLAYNENGGGITSGTPEFHANEWSESTLKS